MVFTVSLSVVVAILVLAGTYYVYRQVSVQTKKSTSQAPRDDQGTQTALKDFNDFYDAFYTDANKTG